MLKRFLFAFFLVGLVSACNLFAYTSPGSPIGFVNDFAKILSPQIASQLELQLSEFEKTSKSEITVVTINSLEGEPIEDYAVRLFEEWKIGKKGADNGLLLLVSKEDREVRIEVGYGLEEYVPDIESGRIISEIITPKFREGNFDEGVALAVNRIQQDVLRDSPPELTETNNTPINNVNFGNVGYIVLIIFISIVRMLARTKSWWMGGVLGGLASLFVGFFAGLTAGIIGLAILVPFGLILDYFVSKKEIGGGGTPPFIFPGGGGFGRGGGGGFGGFGGGRSGGGGSSGSW